VAAVILFLVGWAIIPNLGVHISAKSQNAADWLDAKASLEDLVRIAKREVDECRKQIRDYHIRVKECEIKANIIAEELVEGKERLVGKETILQKINKTLSEYQQGNTIMVNDKPHTWEQVNQDALIRIDSCKALKREIKEKEALLDGLNREVDKAKTKLAIATTKINELVGKIREWEAKIAAKQLEVQISELVSAIKGDLLVETGVGRAMNALQRRYLELDARVTVGRETAVGEIGREMVDWESEIAPKNATDEIQSYFSKPETSEPEPNVELQSTTRTLILDVNEPNLN